MRTLKIVMLVLFTVGSAALALLIVWGVPGFFRGVPALVPPSEGLGLSRDPRLIDYLPSLQLGYLPRLGIGYATTLAGVFLGAAYRTVRGRKRITSIRKLFVSVFYSTDFWLGLFGSPVVFALILQTAAGLELQGFIVVSLQNGFCCVTLVSTLTERPNKAEP